MPYVPLISDLKPFYIQTESDASAVDVTSAYGMVPQSQPYPDDYEVKDPYKNDWKDRDGDDEWVDELPLKAFEHEVKFFVKTFPSATETANEVLQSQRDAFIGKIRRGYFRMYDSSISRGYRNVRFVRSKVTQDHTKDTTAQSWMIFSVTFKVNDPLTRMTLSGGKIVEA